MKATFRGRKIFACLLLGLFCCGLLIAKEPRSGRCTGDKVNVRGGHGDNYKEFPVLYQLNKGNPVSILGQDKGWFKITSDLAPKGTMGDQWVLDKFIQEEQKTEQKIEKKTEKVVEKSETGSTPVFFWAEMHEKETLVDIISPLEGMDLEKLREKYPFSGEAYSREIETNSGVPHYREIKANDPLLPKKIKIGDSFALITEKGVVQRDVKGFGVGPGASEVHFYLILEGNPAPIGSFGLVLPEMVSNPDLLRKPVETILSEADKKPFYAKIQAGLMTLATDEQKKVLEAHPIDEKNCHVFNPKTPLGDGRLVSIHVPLGDARFSALLFVKADGEVVMPLKEISLLEYYEPLYFVDANLDGFDEIIFECGYYEGSYTHLLRWENQKPIDETLTGDGA